MDESPNEPTQEHLVTLVAGSNLFRDVHGAHLEVLLGHLEAVTVGADEVLFREGDAVDGLYILVEGRMEAIDEPDDGDPDGRAIVLVEIVPGEAIGEMQVLRGGSRTATVRASERSLLVRVPRDAFNSLLSRDQGVVAALTRSVKPRLYRSQIVDTLPRLFGKLDSRMLRDIEEKMSWVHLPRGAVLFREGDPSESFYIIISGRLEVVLSNSGGQARQINELAQGDCAGEMGAFTGAPRSATVVASRDSELLEFSRSEFDDLTRSYPQFMRSMMGLLIERLERAYLPTRPTSLSRNILLAPAHDGAPVQELARRLHATLHGAPSGADSGRNGCLLLSSPEVDERMGIAGVSQAAENSPDDLRLRSWLSHQEKHHHIILLLADDTVTNWTKRCARHADEVIYVAKPAAEPRPGPIVAEIHHSEVPDHPLRRRALVLLHDPGVDRPRGTLRWLQALGLVDSAAVRCSRTRHFHIRRDREADFERLARFVTGREVGLVLSGGGARGFAHVGCIQAMRDLNIPIDMIGGVSMGSLVSASYAYDPDGFESKLRVIKSQLRGVLFDFTAPIVSFARGRRFDRRLRDWFGDVRIEDLWVPYFCVSSNLTEASIVVFDNDVLWWAVRASGTLPGLTSPMVRNGCMLFDGCLLDNLPMDVMRERMGTSRVIAVDVVPPHDLKVKATEIQSPSGWWILWQKLTRIGPRVELPNIFLIMRRAAELGSVYARENLISKRLADVYLHPPVEGIEVHDFNRVDEATRIGRDHCHRLLAPWWESQP